LNLGRRAAVSKGTHHQQLMVDAVVGQPRLGVAPASLRASGEQHDVVVERQLSATRVNPSGWGGSVRAAAKKPFQSLGR
jgi:hypothetical protein